MRKFLIALVVLAIVFVVADRLSVYLAQRKVANRVAAAYSLASPPDVTIQGFPFLTQAMMGTYQQVNVALASVVQSGVQLRNLQASFDGVHAPLSQLVGNSGVTITADRAAATALIPFGAVQQRLPAGIMLSPDGGKLRLSGKLGYQGLQVPVSATASLQVTGNAVEVVPQNLTVGGTFPIPPTVLGSRLAIALPLHDLPMHLEVTSVQVTPDGFEVRATARGVAFENRA